MAPRKETIEERTALIAVLLTDTFTQSFEPVSLELPPVLFPVVNVPLIEYTLQWLAANEVDEVVVYCCHHADQIRSYLSCSKWKPDGAFIKVRCVEGQRCSSVGDVLRFVDQMHDIKNDCLLLTGGLISNVDLKPIVSAHLERRSTDANAIVTTVMNVGHDVKIRLRLGEPSSQAIVDAKTHRLLKYKESPLHLRKQSNECDTAVFSERNIIQVHSDMVMSGMYICSREVFALFSENFDYQNVCRDFIGGVLSEEELGNKIFVYENRKAYAQTIENWRSYDAVARDILQRWTHPFIPDSGLFSNAIGTAKYAFQRGNRYLATGVDLSLNAKLQGSVCIGPNTIIRSDCMISNSIIGRDCTIGKESKIMESQIQDGVRLGNGVTIKNALICSGCVLHNGAIVEKGTVLARATVIGHGHRVLPFTHVSLCPAPSPKSSADEEGIGSPRTEAAKEAHPEETVIKAARALAKIGMSSSIDRPADFDNDAVGKLGAGYRWPTLPGSHQRLLGMNPISLKDLEELEDDRADDSDDDSGASAGIDADAAFEKEVVETFLRCVHQKFSKENVVLELNGLRLAEYRTFADCANHIFTTLLQMCMPAPLHVRLPYRSLFSDRQLDLNLVADQKALLRMLKELLKEWSPVLQKFLKDEDDQVVLMFAFEEFFKGEGGFHPCTWGDQLGPLIGNICQLLYDEDVIIEDAFLAWAEEKENATDSEDILFYTKAHTPYFSINRLVYPGATVR